MYCKVHDIRIHFLCFWIIGKPLTYDGHHCTCILLTTVFKIVPPDLTLKILDLCIYYFKKVLSLTNKSIKFKTQSFMHYLVISPYLHDFLVMSLYSHNLTITDGGACEHVCVKSAFVTNTSSYIVCVLSTASS